jgi:uncharacterized protein (DUF1330 family)
MAAYFVFHHRVTNAEKAHEYLSKVGQTLAPYPHELLVSADHSEVIEGHTPLPRTVLIRFDSHEAAEDWYNSPAYRKVRPIRIEATEGYTVLVDGLPSATGR